MSRRSTRIAGVGEGMPIAPVHTMPTLVPSMVPSASVFLQGHYNHPANNKLYLGPNLSHMSNKGHIGGMSAVPKAPKPPEKPLMPYMRYSRKVWDEVKADNLNLKLWQIGKIIGQMWRELPASDKQQFVEEYEMEKLEHLDLMKSYHNSSAYQSYLHAKSRAEAMEASAESLGSEKDDAYMSIEPVDDSVDDMESGFSVKHVAAARFQRNHRLINDILGETVHVPNVRAVVTKHRLNILKNQVQSLQLHQKKLEAELKHIEEVHESKKRKWKEQANSYGKEMKILCEMSPQEYYKEWKQKQQLQAEQAQLQRQQAAEAAAKAASEARTPSTEKEDIGEKVEEQKKIEEGVDPSATSDNISQNTEDISSEEMPSVTDDPAPSTAEEKMDVDVSGNSKDDKTEMVARNEISESSEVTENTSTEQNEEKTVVDADESAGNEENSSKENENNDSEKLETKEDPSPSEKESTDADVSNTSPEEEEEEGEEEEEESGDN